MTKPKLVVVSFSGGKDSTAMLLKMLELGERVDIILFCDTGLEFPQLYDHLRKVEWNMTEANCLNYCRERGYDWGGLYEKMRRVSCWCCPLQSLEELRILYGEFPTLWAQLKRWDEMTWRPFRPDYSVAELEKRFDFEAEWQNAGKPLKGRAFYSALKERLANENGE